MDQLFPYFLITLSVISTLLGIWNVKKEDFQKRQIVIIKLFLTIVAVGTLVISIFKIRYDAQRSLNELSENHYKDSITIALLNDTRSGVSFIKSQTDSILTNVDSTTAQMLINFDSTFKKQKLITNQAYKLQNLLPNELSATFCINFYDDELYNYALTIKQDKNFRAMSLLPVFNLDTSNNSRQFINYMMYLLKGFNLNICIKKKKSKEVLISGDNIIDISKVNILDEYDRYGTIDKSRPFASLVLDENKKCFKLALYNIKVNILYKGQDVVSIKDLEYSTLYMNLGYKHCHLHEWFIKDGYSDTEKRFKRIDITNFYLNAGLYYRASYKDLEDSLGVYTLKNFTWTEH